MKRWAIPILLLVAAFGIYFWVVDWRTQDCRERGGAEVIGRDLICIDAEGRVVR